MLLKKSLDMTTLCCGCADWRRGMCCVGVTSSSWWKHVYSPRADWHRSAAIAVGSPFVIRISNENDAMILYRKITKIIAGGFLQKATGFLHILYIYLCKVHKI